MNIKMIFMHVCLAIMNIDINLFYVHKSKMNLFFAVVKLNERQVHSCFNIIPVIYWAWYLVNNVYKNSLHVAKPHYWNFILSCQESPREHSARKKQTNKQKNKTKTKKQK